MSLIMIILYISGILLRKCILRRN